MTDYFGDCDPCSTAWEDRVLDCESNLQKSAVSACSVSTPAVWERSCKCPNGRTDFGQAFDHLEGCDICKGSGYITWETKNIAVIAQGLEVEESFQIAGEYITGGAKILFPPGTLPNVQDRVTLKDKTMLFSQVVTLGSHKSEIQYLRYKPKEILAVIGVGTGVPDPQDENQERTEFQESISTDSVTVVDADKRKVVLNGLVGRFEHVTIVYKAQMELVVWTILSAVRFDDNPNSSRMIAAICKLDWLIDGNDHHQNLAHHYNNTSPLVSVG